ncbi:recombinase family protein [Bosea sp. LjRoot9]|uniref:recombinase family protein n=1 Tax=Bosea sp. LjRoot9 TaxID=3342341 RepID=UPI003ED16AD2
MENSNSPRIAEDQAEDLVPEAYVALNQKNILKHAKTALKKSTNIVAYIRRSKREDNDSVPRQKRVTAEYVNRTFNCEISRFYIDEHFSGQTLLRPGLIQLMDDAKKGLFSVVILEATDRIGRNLHVIAGLCQSLKTLGVEVHTLEANGPIKNIDIAIRGLLSADQLVLLRERTMQGRTAAFHDGKAVGGPCYGYKLVPGRPGERVIDEEVRPTIEWMFQARLDGLNLRQIQKALLEKNIPTPEGRKIWTHGQIKNLLCNPRYAGIHLFQQTLSRYDGEIGRAVVTQNHVDDWLKRRVAEWEIVKRETFEAVLATFDYKIRRRPARNPGLLSGKVNCGICCRPMKLFTHYNRNLGHTYRYMQCYDAHALENECVKNTVHTKAVEEIVLITIRSMLDRAESEEDFVKEFNEQRIVLRNEVEEERSRLKKKLDDAGRAIDRAMEADLMGVYPADRVAKLREGLVEAYETARDALNALPRTMDPVVADVEQRASLLDAFDRLVASRLANPDRTQMDPKAPVEERAISALNGLIKGVRVYPISGSSSVTLETTLHFGALFKDGSGEAVDGIECLTSKSIIHRDFQRTLKPDELIECYQNREDFPSDAVFEVLHGCLPERLDSYFARPENLIKPRYLIDIMVFLAAKNGNLESMKGFLGRRTHSALRKIVGELAIDGTWNTMCAVLKRDFPELFQRICTGCFDGLVKSTLKRRRGYERRRSHRLQG